MQAKWVRIEKPKPRSRLISIKFGFGPKKVMSHRLNAHNWESSNASRLPSAGAGSGSCESRSSWLGFLHFAEGVLVATDVVSHSRVFVPSSKACSAMTNSSSTLMGFPQWSHSHPNSPAITCSRCLFGLAAAHNDPIVSVGFVGWPSGRPILMHPAGIRNTYFSTHRSAWPTCHVPFGRRSSRPLKDVTFFLFMVRTPDSCLAQRLPRYRAVAG